MIYIERTECPEVLDLTNQDSEAYKEKQAAIAHFRTNNKNFNFEAYSKGNVKEKLKEMCNGKCAYCESKIAPVTYGDIEHFRPKKAYNSNKTDPLEYPGYYWLAMDWNNLLLACDRCNRTYKKNLFPLKSGSDRQLRHDSNIQEDVLLIDPTVIDPRDYIKFMPDGTIQYKGEKDGIGDVSIKTYGLVNPDLTEARQEKAIELVYKITQIENYCADIAEMTSQANFSKEKLKIKLIDLKNVYESLKRANAAKAPYLGMTRELTTEFFEQYQDQIESVLHTYFNHI